MTDADSNAHTNSEGFSGGTKPLYAESHLTAWCYDNPGYEDMQFFKWTVINKGINTWDSVICTIFSDTDLGDGSDDSYGCDSIRNLGYCYNWNNMDGSGSGQTYGANPPAVGIMFLNCSGSLSKMSSYNCMRCPSCPVATCERDPSYPFQAYWYMKGYKKDGTPFLIPGTQPLKTTKFIYSGDPESNSGWTEYLGKINNCGGELSGITVIDFPQDVRFMMGTRQADRILPGQTTVVQICQLIARGTNNLNSITKLKQLADVAKQLCQNGFVIGVTPISTQVPNNFALYQNYPNPFNPTTKIKFSLPNPSEGGAMDTKLTIYDALGREVATLVNEQLKPGTYETQWDGINYPSGVYFYKLEYGEFSQTKKLVLLK